MKIDKGSARLTAEQRRELPKRDFGIPDEREFPLTDAAHVRSAETYFRYAPEGQKADLARRILKKAAEFGVKVHSPTIFAWAERRDSYQKSELSEEGERTV